MNHQFYFEKLKESEEFKNFIKENQSAFFCSAFFSIDKCGNDNKQHFDYFVDGKIFSFQLEEGCKKVPLDNLRGEIPEKLDEDFDFGFEKIERIIADKIQEQGIKNKVQKILLSLQNVAGENFLVGTVFISGLGMIKVSIDIKGMKIVGFEKKSFFDVMNVVRKK